MSNEAIDDPHANESWEEFKRRFGLDVAPAPERPTKSASLGPLRAVVTIIGKGRPRKDAPVHVPKGMKYCWLCWSLHPVDSFAIDRRNHDGKRRNCRSCDSAAAYGRKLKRQMKAASNLSMGA